MPFDFCKILFPPRHTQNRIVPNGIAIIVLSMEREHASLVNLGADLLLSSEKLSNEHGEFVSVQTWTLPNYKSRMSPSTQLILLCIYSVLRIGSDMRMTLMETQNTSEQLKSREQCVARYHTGEYKRQTT